MIGIVGSRFWARKRRKRSHAARLRSWAGGGGSHLVRLLSHVGFRSYVIYDPDRVEHSNLNRMVTATLEDAERKALKVDVSKREILKVEPAAEVEAIPKRWQEDPEPLKACDIIFGSVDGLAERREIEVFTRRHLIAYIDVGLDVNSVAGEPPQMAGQVILSMPGHPCLKCLRFLNDGALAQEARQYGEAGPRPQVVWANGTLASAAVGVAVDIITDWTNRMRGPVYLSYDANRGTVMPHPRLKYLEVRDCPHFPASEVGAPRPVKV